jgi:hypothetical protein
MRISAALAALALMLTGGFAAAEPVRAPLSGSPALMADAPDGWLTKRNDSDHLSDVIVGNPDRSGFITVAVVTIDGPLPAMRAMAQEVAGGQNATLQDGSEPGSIDGHAGETFLAFQTQGAVEVHTRYVIVALDDHHVGLVATTWAVSDTDAQRHTLDALAASVRVAN